MLRSITRISCFLALILAASFAAAQAEFSAEIVDLQNPARRCRRRSTSPKTKCGSRSQDSSARGGGAVIVNFATQNTRDVLMRATAHVYGDAHAGPEASV